MIPLEAEYLRTLSFILVIAVIVQFTEMVIHKTSPLLYQLLGIFLPLITTNCAVLGLALLNVQEEHNFITATLYGFGAALGFSLVLILFAAMRERLDAADVPVPFRGSAIALITAGLMSLAFMGFAVGLKIMLLTIISLGVIASLFGLLLGYSSVRFRIEGDPLDDKVDSLLPQTQCGQCGFPGCRPYAEALVKGEAEINLCVPGGEDTIVTLAETLGREVVPISDEHASHVPSLAVIIEDWCIGCTKCIQARPVDAIVGTAKQMHTVIAAECTGCELCLPPARLNA